MRVLFIAYHFPPFGGAGAQRSTKLVRYLPEFDVEPIVVTQPLSQASRWSPVDASLSDELPPNTPVYRPTRAGSTPPSRYRLRLERLLQLQSRFGSWWNDACLEAGDRAAADHSIDLVYVSMDPFEGAKPAARLAQKLRVPWVADLRDPWALDEMRVYPTHLHRAMEMRRMRSALSSASFVIMNTPRAAEATKRQIFPRGGPAVLSLTNGFDAADFAGPELAPGKDLFRIVHTGYLHTALGKKHRRTAGWRRIMGGERVSVDILPRSHVFLLEALERWAEEAPEDADRVRLVLAGPLTDADRSVIEESRVGHLVETRGLLEHQESVDLARSADVLFLPMHDIENGDSYIIPGKTYEYLAAGPRILAAVPEGDAKDLLSAHSDALVVPPKDVEKILSALKELWRLRTEGREPSRIRLQRLQMFERRSLAERLARWFHEVAEGRTPRDEIPPSSAPIPSSSEP